MNRPSQRKSMAHQHDASLVMLWLEGGLMVFAGAFLVWCVVTKSLPYVFAKSDPEFALRLNPDHPDALVALAERARGELFELTSPEDPAAALPENADESENPGREVAQAVPKTNAEERRDAKKIDALRERIRDLTSRAIVNAPLNAEAFRLLAEISDDPERTRQLMQEAVKRSRREMFAVLWLLADSYERRDYSGVVEKADILLRTRAAVEKEAMQYLGALAAIPEGRSALADVLAQRPDWRRRFLSGLPRYVRYADTPYNLLVELADAGAPPAIAELAPYLNTLIKAGLTPYAYEIWKRFVPDEKRGPALLLTNGDFVSTPNGLLFDWSIARGKNVISAFAPYEEGKEGARSIRFDFGIGRVEFPELSQTVVLTPGKYRLSGRLRGFIRARRGVRWEVRCWRAKILARTDMLFGNKRQSWQGFSLNFEVPDQEDCRAQQLRLFHDARSASEQLISGQIAFASLTLSRSTDVQLGSAER